MIEKNDDDFVSWIDLKLNEALWKNELLTLRPELPEFSELRRKQLELLKKVLELQRANKLPTGEIQEEIEEALDIYSYIEHSTYEDEPLKFSFDRKIDWVDGEHLLNEKACQRHRCEPPEFTERELEERRQLIEFLKEKQLVQDHCTDDIVVTVLSLPRPDFHSLLFLLARCGDESAFLELLSRDATFISHPFFARSLEGWTVGALEGDEFAKDVLKKVVDVTTQSVLVKAGIKGRGRPKKDEINRERFDQYWNLLVETPDEQDSVIFRLIAKRELKKEKQDQRNRGLIVDDIKEEEQAQRAKAIKKVIQRNFLHYYRQGKIPTKLRYKYLKEEY
tara:strand:+ start:1519 stop:2523 length:1005 start_codon:yes stop_codon:yes gene_type:complete